jgi:hypothetical protein
MVGKVVRMGIFFGKWFFVFPDADMNIVNINTIDTRKTEKVASLLC